LSRSLGASLFQIGEFSFFRADLGIKLKVLPEAGRDLILAGAILSMFSPLLFVLFDPLMS
jgi:CPA2 family monovalent cation:H+ antiporter-2